MRISVLVSIFSAVGTAQAGFYLPGVAPKSYDARENVRDVVG